MRAYVRACVHASMNACTICMHSRVHACASVGLATLRNTVSVQRLAPWWIDDIHAYIRICVHGRVITQDLLVVGVPSIDFPVGLHRHVRMCVCIFYFQVTATTDGLHGTAQHGMARPLHLLSTHRAQMAYSTSQKWRTHGAHTARKARALCIA